MIEGPVKTTDGICGEDTDALCQQMFDCKETNYDKWREHYH